MAQNGIWGLYGGIWGYVGIFDGDSQDFAITWPTKWAP